MPVDYATEYFQAMEVIKARETMQSNGIALWPNLKPESRNKYHRDLLKRAGYDSGRRVATASDLRRIIGEDNGR